MMLTDGTLTIRPFSEVDLDAAREAAIESAVNVGAWFAWVHPGVTIEEAANFAAQRADAWARGTERGFLVERAADKRLLGGVWLDTIDYDEKSANLGFWVRTSALRSGVATAASRLCLKYAFDELGLDRADILVAIGNQASQRVAENLGAEAAGIAQAKLVLRGVKVDSRIYTIRNPAAKKP
jgi:ribosomal-protein-serine acetyltransferase